MDKLSKSGPEKSNEQNDNDKRFKWFMSLTRRKNKNKLQNKENQSENDEKNESQMGKSISTVDIKEETKKCPYNSNNNNNIFFTLRKRIQKKFTSSRQHKVLALDMDLLRPNIESNHNNCDVRVIIDQHNSLNPIQLTPSGNVTTTVILNENNTPTLPVHRNINELTNEDGASNPDISNNIYVNVNDVRDKVMTNERLQLAKYGWYWGPLSRNAAQKRLTGQVNGSFLIRDSQTDKYQFTLSFRSVGCTLHSRIDYINGYWHIETGRYKSVVDLIEDTMKKSEIDVFCYVKSSSQLQPPFPVRLQFPINRFYEVTSLQHLCRFIIRHSIDLNNVEELPLPSKLLDYVKENFYENL